MRLDARGRRTADWRWKSVIGASLTALLAAFVATAALRSSVAEVFQATRPARALSWQPGHAGASANAAHRLVAAGRAADASQLALRAIGRDPIEATAYSALGLVAGNEGDGARARHFMILAHSLSRRERATEAWLIRNAIQAGDFGLAVRYFDVAIRTSRPGSSDLMPILIAATADRRMLGVLAPLIAAAPWKNDFLVNMAARGPLLPAAILSRGRLDPSIAEERAILQRLIARLAENNQFDLAWAAYREARPGTPNGAAAAVRGFAHAGGEGFPPLDWRLSDDPGLTAMVDVRSSGDRSTPSLSLFAEGGRTGDVASQLVRLPQGASSIRFEVGAVPQIAADRPRVTIRCAPAGPVLYTARPPGSGERAQQIQGMLSVPSGCPWQWVTVSIASSTTPDPIPWIRNIVVRSATMSQ